LFILVATCCFIRLGFTGVRNQNSVVIYLARSLINPNECIKVGVVNNGFNSSKDETVVKRVRCHQLSVGILYMDSDKWTGQYGVLQNTETRNRGGHFVCVSVG